MSDRDEFWQYAREAILSVSEAKTEEDKQGLLDLARTWTAAALRERSLGPLSAAEASAARKTASVGDMV
jgi:hypothetical protein